MNLMRLDERKLQGRPNLIIPLQYANWNPRLKYIIPFDEVVKMRWTLKPNCFCCGPVLHKRTCTLKIRTRKT